MSLWALMLACAPRVGPVMAPPAAPPAADPPAAAAAAPVAATAPQPLSYPLDYVPLDLAGTPMPFSRWEGRVVMVNLWASWCPPCLHELPALRQVHEAHAAAGLVLVGLAIDDTAAGASQAFLERELKWPVAMDQGTHAGPIFGTNELPTTLLYGPDGALVWKHAGPLQADDPDLAAALAELLD
ncbi:MAG: TlpA family protein disulfide reductase [Alphaproteobacteria bacterium]|nr:TlpA family protein disulfide reductase [Alphaproteobacteria bacterium]